MIEQEASQPEPPAPPLCANCEQPLPAPRTACRHCGASGAASGYEWRSKAEWMGAPVVHVAWGHDADGRMRVACGVVAVGQRAQGGLAIGVMAFGLVPIGLVAVGAFSLGVVSVGIVALGVNAFGGLALGLAAAGWKAFGVAVLKFGG